MLAIYTFCVRSILAFRFQLCLHYTSEDHHLGSTVPPQTQCLIERYALEYRTESGFAVPTFRYKGYLDVALFSSSSLY